MPTCPPTRFVRPLVVLLAAGPAAFAPADGPATRPAADTALATAAGNTVRPLVLDGQTKAVVVLFVAVDCPLANASAPTMAALGKTFADRGVAFYVVYADPDSKPADVLKHQAAYALPGTALLDPHHRLADALGAKVTPTAFVIGPGGAVCYDGAIDNAFAGVGRKRFAPTKHYVADALSQLLADKPVGVKHADAVGCEL